MEREAAQEAYETLHGDDAGYHDGTFTRWSGKRSAEFPYAAGSGVTIGVADSDVAPWDKFTTDRSASPLPPSGDEVEPDERGED